MTGPPLFPGELAFYNGVVWEVARVWDSNTEGFRANLARTTDDGVPVRCTVPLVECQRIG